MDKHPILQGQLAEDSGIPLYYQLVGIVKRNITGGILKPGDRVPSEAEICDAYHVSRSTVRQALGALESEGFIIRRRGKGTFIASPKLKRKLHTIYSFSADMLEQGLSPSSKIITFEKLEPSLDLIKNLKLVSKDNLVYKIIRVRLANEEPLLLETTFIPVKFCTFLEKEMLETGSLYKLLKERAGVIPFNATETYEPIILKKSEAEILKCKSGMCGFFVQRISHLENGEVFELTQSFVRGDRCRFEVELYKDSVNFIRKISEI
ncbi:MAG TPA: GntR family transcriptional regulator [Clostridiaceae bacterium]